jgi:hypothetical protein
MLGWEPTKAGGAVSAERRLIPLNAGKRRCPEGCQTLAWG